MTEAKSEAAQDLFSHIEVLAELEGLVIVRGFAFDAVTGGAVTAAFIDARTGAPLPTFGPHWHDRPDVARIHRLADPRVGFRAAIATGDPTGVPFDPQHLEVHLRPAPRGGAGWRGRRRPADRPATVIRASELILPAMSLDDPARRLANGFLDGLADLGEGAVLELGSRARSGITRRHYVPGGVEYVGLDVLDGPNVDVVGDAHQLSTLLPVEHFTHAFAVSVWEHLLSPWVVSLELNAVLREGGLVMVQTHQSWPVHDEPSDYWRYSKWSWHALFNEGTGFEIVESAMGDPGMLVSLIPTEATIGLSRQASYLTSVAVARKTGPPKIRWTGPTVPDEVCYPA